MKFYARFNSCLQLKHRIVDAHIILLYARETVLRTATRGRTQRESTTDRGKQRKILQEKESVKCKREVLNRKSNGLALRNINKNHPHRSIRASASVDADDRSREYEEEKRWGKKGKEEREAEERGV